MLIRASLFLLLMSAHPVTAASLPPCPDSPNCVSSVAEDPDKSVEPLSGGTDAASALQHLTQVLEALPRVRFEVRENNRAVSAVFETRWLGFKDDVDFLVRDDGTIEVRSASRTGYWDLGANRRRVERLREKLHQAIESTD